MSTRTLLLTPWYMPKTVLHWQDAIKMIYEGTVDVVASYDEEARSPSVTWKMPAVVRLKRLPKREMRNGVRFSRANVYARDGYCCQYCQTPRKLPMSELTYDHVVPKSAGGRRAWDNIVTACKACNSRKADMTCDASGMWPRRPPRQPKSVPYTGPIIDPGSAPAEWLSFLPATA